MSSDRCLDLVFTIDATISMDKYIAEAQKTIHRIVSKIATTSHFRIRFGLVQYRDHPNKSSNGFVTKTNGFTENPLEMQSWLNTVEAYTGDEGCDWAEAVEDGLYATLMLWTQSPVPASSTNARVCVLISDAPPHGLDSTVADNFPNGCPNGHDPLEIANKLAENGVTIYVAGCEPSISPHRDIFMAFAKITGGLYIPLASSNSLSDVIIGCAREEISLRQLMETVEQDVRKEYEKNKGVVDEKSVSESLLEKFEGRKILQLQMDGGSLPKISPRAKRYARFDKITSVKKKFIKGPKEVMLMNKNPVFSVIENDINITHVQRMVQKAIMVHHLGE